MADIACTQASSKSSSLVSQAKTIDANASPVPTKTNRMDENWMDENV